MKKKNPDIIWYSRVSGKNPKLEINKTRVAEWLCKEGFGLYFSDKSKTNSGELLIVRLTKQNRIEVYDNEQGVKRYILNYFKYLDESKFELGKEYGVLINPHDMLCKSVWSKCEVIERILKNDIVSTLSLSMTNVYHPEEPKLLQDTKDIVYLKFQNCVIEITKSNVKMLKWDEIDGAVWDTDIVKRNFKIEDFGDSKFKEFFEKSMYDKSNPTARNWKDRYVINEERIQNLKECYGYLLSSHKNPSVPKAVVCLDEYADESNAEGGTGKSLVINSVEYFKEMMVENGKNVSNVSSIHFLSEINHDTKLVHIEDISGDFNFKSLYVHITGVLSIRPLYKQMIRIPYHRSPKFSITTNFISTDMDTSTRRRQNIVEFGSYWNDCKRFNESPEDSNHLGISLFNDFDNSQWNQFYNFGIHCVQEFLNKGIREMSLGNLMVKALRQKIEGTDVTGECEWIKDWLVEDRVDGGYYKDTGISSEVLFDKFQRENPMCVMGAGMNYKKVFVKHLYQVCEVLGYEYNSHKAHKGNTPTKRRYQVLDDNGNKIEHLLITHKDDENLPKSTNKETFSKDDSKTHKLKKTSLKPSNNSSNSELTIEDMLEL